MGYLESKGSITNKKARELTGLSADGIKSLFRRMMDKNVLIRQGEKMGTNYTLISNTKSDFMAENRLIVAHFRLIISIL